MVLLVLYRYDLGAFGCGRVEVHDGSQPDRVEDGELLSQIQYLSEVFAGTLFQWLDLASVGVEPMAWYVMLEFAAYALGMGLLFAVDA